MTHADAPSPDAILDAIRDHPEWDDRERTEQFERLVAQFDPERLAAAARARLHDLRGHDGEAVLYLLDALDEPALWDDLARALLAQPGLRADRAFEALQLLQKSGRLTEFPDLAGLFVDYRELFLDAGSIEELASQIEQDNDGVWFAIDGLSPIEPQTRAMIISELAERPLGPNLIELMRLLVHAHDPLTRTAALDALAGCEATSEPALAAAWASLAADHCNPEIAARAGRWLKDRVGHAPVACLRASRHAPRILSSLITDINGSGRGTIVLAAEQDEEFTEAVFECDVECGFRKVYGQVGIHPDSRDSITYEFMDGDSDWIATEPGPALGLLAGCLPFCDHRTPPCLRYWLERTAGPGFRPRRMAEMLPEGVPATVPRAKLHRHAKWVLTMCPSWVDLSPLTVRLSEELAVRYGEVAPDPVRDEALFRQLFQHRFEGRLDCYQRMLIWTAIHCETGEFAEAALTLACHLSDPANAVPSHPFVVELISASLRVADMKRSRGELDVPGAR